MNVNHAQDALNEMTEDSIPSNTVSSVINGIRTVGPIITAVLSNNSIEIEEDLSELLSGAKKLMDQVNSLMLKIRSELKQNELAAINAVCIKVVSENWRLKQELYDDWAHILVKAMTEPNISTENSQANFSTQEGIDLCAQMTVSAQVLTALKLEYEEPLCEDKYLRAIEKLNESVNQAVDKLTDFHIPYEDAESARSVILTQAGNIFTAVIARESMNHRSYLRRLALEENPLPTEELSLDEMNRQFSVAMNAFVEAVYENSRDVH